MTSMSSFFPEESDYKHIITIIIIIIGTNNKLLFLLFLSWEKRRFHFHKREPFYIALRKQLPKAQRPKKLKLKSVNDAE